MSGLQYFLTNTLKCHVSINLCTFWVFTKLQKKFFLFFQTGYQLLSCYSRYQPVKYLLTFKGKYGSKSA